MATFLSVPPHPPKLARADCTACPCAAARLRSRLSLDLILEMMSKSTQHTSIARSNTTGCQNVTSSSHWR
eukprot:2141772-Pleurochrysis_carterae.AAC.3